MINYETFTITKHAPTPPMGYNTWNTFGPDVTEDEFKAQIDYVAEHLKAHGYEYMVVDLGWYGPHLVGPKERYKDAKPEQVMDEWGRLIPTPNRWPSCANGSFKPIADYVHAKGLKFGIHIMRGIPWQAVEENLPIKGGDGARAQDVFQWDKTCVFYDGMRTLNLEHPASQAYYDSLVELYVEWGVDFIKADDMTSYPPKHDELKALRYAIERKGKGIVLSLSPGAVNPWDRNLLQHFADMYRASGDVYDNWEHIDRAFQKAKWFYQYSGPNGWMDMDMLVVGTLGLRYETVGYNRPCTLTRDEQITHLTLWMITRSPLFLGCDLREMDDWTLAQVTNRLALEIDQTFENPEPIVEEGSLVVWRSAAPDGQRHALAIFNRSEEPLTHQTEELASATDVWSGRKLTSADLSSLEIPPHGARFLVV